MKMCSRSACQPLALHQRQQRGDRKRERHESEMETSEDLCYETYGLCEETDVLVWRGEVSTHTPCCVCDSNAPPWDEQTDVWRGCTGMLGPPELILPSSNDFLFSSHHHHHFFLMCSSGLPVTILQGFFILISQTFHCFSSSLISQSSNSMYIKRPKSDKIIYEHVYWVFFYTE